MGPLLDGLRELGGSARPRDASEWIAKNKNIPQAILEETLKSGSDRFHNQVQWARQYLVWEGLIDSSTYGKWTLTPKGWSAHLTEDEGHKLFLKWVAIHQKARKQAAESATADASQIKPEYIPSSEIEEAELLEILRALPPDAFERICRRLLSESGFENVEVTGRSHDGGIDGIGVLRLNPFIAMKIVFQCKRTKGSVGRSAVGDFRNAMLGRAEKGILLTTGTFSSDAKKEANRDGVPPIELVDGERLVEMFEEKRLGVVSRQTLEIDHAFFDQFRSKDGGS